MAKKLWTDEEMQILKDNCETKSDEELNKLLPRHSLNGISYKRRQMGVKRKRGVAYTFEEIAFLVGERGYELLSDSTEYIDTQSKIRFNCPKHGEQSIRVNHFLDGKGCGRCGNEESGLKRRKRDADLIDLYKSHCEEHNLTFIGMRREYVNNHGRLWIKYICNIHKSAGVKEVRADAFISKNQGCSECAKEKSGLHLLLPYEKVIERVKEKNANLEIVGEYKSLDKRLTVRCTKCNTTWDAYVYTYMKCPMCEHYYMGEKLTAEYLKENEIEYFEQYKFDDCVYKYPLKFDFFLPNQNICIEYNGSQHYKPCDIFGGEEQFEVQQIRDNIKRQYCKDNGIKLIEIPYTYNTKEKIQKYLKENM